MRNNIYRLLNIKRSESKYVFDLLLVQLFIGISNAYTSILAFTLFINRLEIRELPQAYIVIAAALLFLNMIYEKLEHRFSPLQLLRFIIAGSIAVLIFLWFGLEYGDPHTFIFTLLIWSTLFYMVAGYAFWGLVSLLFNVRESRRVFSVVGAGDIPAKLIGYISTPLFISLFGLNNLMWFAIATLVCGLIIFNRIIKKEQWDVIRNRSHSQHLHQSRVTRKDLVAFFFKNELIFTISLLSILSYNVYLLVDYTFLSEVRFRFSNVASLATFIAAFFAVGRLLAVVMKLIFVSRMIERLGLISCLFITPTILLLMCVSFFSVNGGSGYNVYLFGIMAMLTEVLRSAVQEPIFFILFQPLRENLRLKGHIISKGYMLPFSLLTVGGTLFFIFSSELVMTIELTVNILIVNILIWTVVIFLIRRSYISTLHASIKKGFFSSDSLHLYGKDTIEILLNKLNEGNPTEVIYSLRLLENAHYKKLDVVLHNLLKRSSHEVQLYVLERMEVRNSCDVALMKDMINGDVSDLVRVRLFRILCRLDQDHLISEARRLYMHEPMYQKIIVSNLMNQREYDYIRRGVDELQRYLSSSRTEDRMFAIDIIEEIHNIRFSEELLELLNDREPEVQRHALLVACKLKMHKLLPKVFGMLTNASQKYLAIKGLHLYGDELFKDLEHVDVRYADHLDELVRIAGKARGIYSTSFVLALVDDNRVSQHKVVSALWSKEDYMPKKHERLQLRQLISRFMEQGVEKIGYYFSPSVQQQNLLKQAIVDEVRRDLITILRGCAIVYQKKEINRLIELFDSGKGTRIYNAMEMADLLLPKNIGRELNVFFDFILDPENANRHAHVTRNVEDLETAMVASPSFFDPYSQALFLYTYWQRQDKRLSLLLQRIRIDSDSMLLNETRNFITKSVT